MGTDLHDDLSLTDSGYPRVVREWKRGTQLSESSIIYEGVNTDVSVRGYVVSVIFSYVLQVVMVLCRVDMVFTSCSSLIVA